MLLLRHNLLQMTRVPLRTTLFAILLALAVVMCSSGFYLWGMSALNAKAFESAFSTVATVRQIEDGIDQIREWDAILEDYRYSRKPAYNEVIPVEVLNFQDAGYIHPPTKRPYYGAFVPDFDNGIQYNIPTLRVIVEASPFEDAIPNEPIKMKVKNELYGEAKHYNNEIWYCDRRVKEPQVLMASETYVMSLTENLLQNFKGYENRVAKIFTRTRSEEIFIEGEPPVTPGKDYEVVYEGYYDTPRGRRWSEVGEGLYKILHTIPVIPTDSTELLMDFHNGNAWVFEGRDISEEEYSEGTKVCLIPARLAYNNNLSVGDTWTLPMYMADYTGSIGVKNFHLLNSEGESYEPFEEIDYRVIGIYKSITSSYEPGYFALDENAVIVPTGSIKNSEENNIVADGPMQHHNTSFQIPNGTIESYMEKWNLLGINNIEINFYDRNFTQLQAELKAVKNAAILLLLLGLVSTLLIAVVYVYLSIVKGKYNGTINRYKKSANHNEPGIIIIMRRVQKWQKEGSHLSSRQSWF